MGKSMGNFSTIRDVITKYAPKVVRFWLVGTHYRNPIGFGEEELNSAAKGLERLETAKFNWEHLIKQPAVPGELPGEQIKLIRERIGKTKEDFIAGMEDDFNTPQALASLYELVREVNRWTQEKEFQLTSGAKETVQQALEMLLELGAILGLFGEAEQESDLDPAMIEDLIAQRTQAKKDKNWTLADQIRDDLKAKGIILEDTPQGVRWKME
jgi:cysteinyl-tRNA synthetase